ncbi:hypothetical protein [Pseudodesulfovibrio sp. S3]|uniref:hypothetical protein n=2 Tax=unclassified Pseudodesulfovibrio TaxID=2661612 RepID=UPI000FEB5FF5|nr:hypothetical protein [Pseudodesulfovibrio sp. S3]MCJ2164179.1 hypothetical protein [Pseudodesulfovibrio sp. S3-i]
MKNGIIVIISIFVLFVGGCAGSFSEDGGLEPVETIVLDDDFAAQISVARADVFALDMINPVHKGHRISGAFFDPSMLRMERFIEYDNEGELRARYLFSALADGSSDVLIKMVPVSGGDQVVFKQVSVSVSGGGWLD